MVDRMPGSSAIGRVMKRCTPPSGRAVSSVVSAPMNRQQLTSGIRHQRCWMQLPAPGESKLFSESQEELFRTAIAPQGDPSQLPPTILVFAHPDDETVALGARLGRFARAHFVHVTDGAPRTEQDSRWH